MNLVYYNPLGLYRDYDTELNDSQYKKIQSLFNRAISIYDRTNTIESPVKITNQYPIPIEKSNASFEELCHSRIKEIVSQDHEIGILFSGGIDSTLVTVLLLETIKPADYDRITFFYNAASVVENPDFFNQYIRNRFKTGSSWNFSDWLNQSNRIMLTGECADNLFGSLTVKSIINSVDDPTILNKPYQPIVEQLWRSKLKDDFNTIYPQFIELSLKCPFKITTVHDWFWWLNFTMKWQAVIYRIYSHTDLLKTKNKIVHFFNTDEFQSWSLTNPDLKVKRDWSSYKWLMKEMIYRFDGNSDYRDNKVKYPSLPSMLRFKRVTDYIDEDFNSVNRSQIILN